MSVDVGACSEARNEPMTETVKPPRKLPEERKPPPPYAKILENLER